MGKYVRKSIKFWVRVRVSVIVMVMLRVKVRVFSLFGLSNCLITASCLLLADTCACMP